MSDLFKIIVLVVSYVENILKFSGCYGAEEL